MPTGYTAELMEKGQTFPEFVMGCACAFGALISMRDDPNDTTIPEKFEPSDYHSKRLAKSMAELAKLESMTHVEKEAFGQSKKDAVIKQEKEWLVKEAAENRRLDYMQVQVARWNPPTPDHRELKAFMINQISISRNDISYIENSLAEAERKTAIEFYEDTLSAANRSVTHNAEENAKEIVRANERTEWVQRLRGSIYNA